jgi:hypothetical protein
MLGLLYEQHQLFHLLLHLFHSVKLLRGAQTALVLVLAQPLRIIAGHCCRPCIYRVRVTHSYDLAVIEECDGIFVWK